VNIHFKDRLHVVERREVPDGTELDLDALFLS